MTTAFWRRLDLEGHDRCVLEPDAAGYRLAGTALVVSGGDSYDIRYTVITDGSWRTRVVAAHLQGPSGDRRLSLKSDGEGHWSVGDESLPELDGCLDVDLGFTPAANTLPIRRLGLEVGAATDISAAYVDFPNNEIRREQQRYERVEEGVYRYSVGDDPTELTVDENGLVTDFPGMWVAI
ncbi:MAG: putative glycolipid-binding domain-containing protein [Acidimicrobiia bacterium]|nr:putative glycolipid-binding domain-containing protein [Acidimicrobiia bacterium]